jgi:hypothetical protein
MILSKNVIAEIMDVWAYPHQFMTEEMEYINYLTRIRDTQIWHYLDARCGFDVVTALKIAEMQ